MTDKQQEPGSETEIQEETFAPEEGESLQAERWQDELPPEDDFHDHSAEQAELVEEEGAVDDDSSPASGFEAAPENNRGRNVMFIAIAAGALLVGGLAYLQFGGSESAKGSGPVPVASVLDVRELNKSLTAEVPVPASGDLPVSPTTGETDLSSLYKAAQQQSSGATALPLVDGKDGSGDKGFLGSSTPVMTADGGVAPATAESTAANVPTPVKAEPAVPSVAKIETVPVAAPASASEAAKAPEAAKAAPPPLPVALGAPAPAPAPTPIAAPVATPAPAAASAEAEARLKDLSSQVEGLKKALDEASQQNAQLLTKIETLQGAQAKVAEGQDQKTSLEARIRELEQQLAARAEEQKRAAKALSSSKEKAKPAPAEAKEPSIKVEDPMAAALAGVSLDHVMDEPAAQPAKIEKPAPKKAPPLPAKKAEKKKKPAPVKTASSKEKWTLRAATPDAVWVSAGAESAELRRVAVGETLAGVGRIKEIRQNGDKWEVVGTKGSLR